MGIFLATTPFIGIKVFIALLITSLLHWNRKASVLGVYHVNALTAPFFYSAAFIIGKAVMGIQSGMLIKDHINFRSMLDMFFGCTNVFWAISIGGVILGLPLSYAAYLLVNNVLIKRQINEQPVD